MFARADQPAAAKQMLDLAARLALRGFGRVEPNPMVGCVIARETAVGPRVLGLGHHRVFGGPHAEAEALADCRRRGNDPAGATAYVTLEPCAAHGTNPPCTHALIHAKIARVVYARRDPNPAKAGGAAALRAAGIDAMITAESVLATRVADPFIKRIATGLPWVIAKWAQTMDGRVATRTGESKWISGEFARRRVHVLRSRVDAVLTGIGTVLSDDPRLTARLDRPPRRVAQRVVADSDLSLPHDSNLAQTARDVPVVLAAERSMAQNTYRASRRAELDQLGVHILPVGDHGPGRGLNLREMLTLLARERGVSTVLVEAGPGLLGSLFADDLVDEALVYIAPILLGDEMAKGVAVGRVADKLSNATRFDLVRVKRLGSDIEAWYRRPMLLDG